MTLYSKNNLGTLLGLLISIMFGLLCCSTDQAPKQTTKSVPQSLDTLADELDNGAAEGLIGYYLDSDGDDVDDNFFFDGKMEEKDKVISFRLNPKQAADFFEELDSLKNDKTHPGDSVRIRIRMAFRGKNGMKLKKGINLAPLLELIVNDNNPTGNFYPLRPFKSDFLPQFDNLYKDATENIGLNRIQPSEAKKLIEKWNSIPVNDVTEQLYLDNKKGIPGGRLKYYTFDVSDTKAIYNYQNNLAGNKNKCYFYIHLGNLQEREFATLRTIIHLDDNPIPRSKKDRIMVGEPPYFEFAAQCPNHCL